MHNPLFYERQRMRASTYGIPRFLHCFDETIDGGLILPRGMLLDQIGELHDLARHGEIGSLGRHQRDA